MLAKHAKPEKAPMYPTVPIISTITSTGTINAKLDLMILFDCIEINPYDFYSTLSEGQAVPEYICVYVEFGKSTKEVTYRGCTPKMHKNMQQNHKYMPPIKKRFANQTTIIFMMPDMNMINMKVFKNGNVQMTGLKREEFCAMSIKFLVDAVRGIHLQCPEIICESYEANALRRDSGVRNIIDTCIDDLKMIDDKIQLINCDFQIGWKIKRNQLYELLVFEYDMQCSFEVCIYPAVKIGFYYNHAVQALPGLVGMCACGAACDTILKKARKRVTNAEKEQGVGDTLGTLPMCKKITVAVFQSGSIIITGGNRREHIDAAYDWICDVLKRHEKTVRFDEESQM
jgi:TATA-box binding protein (TBP) (component of TFIID and TFIIIB)